MSKDAVLIIVSDLHLGSRVAPWPPGVTLEEGGEYICNRIQVQLNVWWSAFWNEFLPPLARKRRRIIVINGDLVEGDRHNPAALVTASMADQRKAALALLQDVVKPRQDAVYVIRGTESHTGYCGSDEEGIAQALGCKPEPGTGHYSRYHLWLKINDAAFSIAHHIGVSSSPVSEGTALTTQLLKAWREAGQWGEEAPDVLVRSHRHRYYYIEAPGKRGKFAVLTTPGWQAKTPFVQRIDPTALPQIGGVVVTVDASGAWAVHSFVKALPMPEAEEVVFGDKK